MKRVTKTETISKTVFEAIDGTEFTDEKKCRDWEDELQCTINAAWNKIPKATVNYSDIFWGSCEDDEIIIIKPRNIEDIKIINIKCRLSEKEALTQDDIGKEIYFTVYCGDDYYKSSQSLKDAIETIKKHMVIAKDDLNNYALYKIKFTAGQQVGEVESYSLYQSRELVKNSVRSFLYKFEGLQKVDATLTIYKNDKEYATEEYCVEYNKADWSSFKFEKQED